MNIELLRIEKNDPRLESIFPDYVSEMVKYLDPGELKNRSIEPGDILEEYWGQSPTWSYLIIADEEVAGFCLLRHYPGESGTIDIDQYYVLDDFRRRGVGVTSLAMLIKIHPGNWLIRVLKTNEGAVRFWMNTVLNCAAANYQNRSEEGEKYFIRFSTVTSN